MTREHAHDHGTHEHHAHRPEPLDYTEAVEEFRAEKDDYFRSGEASPLPAERRAGFPGLPYFPVDPDLRFDDLPLEPYVGTEPARFAIPTSDGALRPATRAGILRFPIDGQVLALTAYTFEQGDDEGLFVPFVDATSGTETYAAGRYLDLYPEEDGTYALDFNLAYHPSCVYDPRFSCPLTPAENRLAVRIGAGERLPLEAPSAHDG